MKYTFEAISQILKDAVAQEAIFNVDYNDVKDRASRLLEADIQEIRAKYMHCGKWENNTETENDFIDSLNYVVASFPSKKALKLQKEIGECAISQDVQAVFDKWAEVSANMKAAKAFIIKGRKPSATPRKTKERTIENTGTCACCGRNVKLKGGKIVAHGYTIAWGFQSGNCFGVGYDPIEVSNEGLVAFEKALITQAKKVNDTKIKFEEERPVIRRLNHRGKVTNEWKDGDAGYDYAFKNRLHELGRELEMIGTSLERVADQIEKWKPGRVPG